MDPEETLAKKTADWFSPRKQREFTTSSCGDDIFRMSLDSPDQGIQKIRRMFGREVEV
jgi:hypothetical protein